jgi:MFS family permease
MATRVSTVGGDQSGVNMPLVIAASSVGTTIEWYDFYIYGSLAVFFASVFFPKGNPTAAFLASLATFGAGFAVRPFGAIVFGRVGDLVGRKYAFVVTLTVMGLSTFLVGLLPTYEKVGVLAPILLVALRLLQGLALGGEYGGAATYVAEHAPDHKRGYYTSYIQTTATLGLLVALIVIYLLRQNMSEADFKAYGWRIPFLLSAVLLAISLYIRIRLREAPLFKKLKDQGKSSSRPLTESLGSGRNWRMMMLALFGATAGQAVVWYTGQFYALFFLQSICKLNYVVAYKVVGWALLIATPFFIVFGALSDKIGRKMIIMAGCIIAAITYVPIYQAMKAYSNPLNFGMLLFLVTVQVVYVTMVYGPIAAFLVEFFPAKIRYTSMSLPYHLGNGEFGGWTPFIATAIVTWAGTSANPWIKDHAIYMGLVWPIGIAVMTFIIGLLFIRETKDVRIWDEVGGREAASSAD